MKGLVFVNVVYGIGFTTLFFRNYYAAFPQELVRSARMDGADFFGVLFRILLPSSGPIIVVTVIWQFWCRPPAVSPSCMNSVALRSPASRNS